MDFYLKLLLFNTIKKIYLICLFENISHRMWPRVAPYAAHILGCQARVYTKTVTSRVIPLVTTVETPGHTWRHIIRCQGRCHHGVRAVIITLPAASVAECNAEGTKCVNFPNLQQQLVWRPFSSRNHNHCTMQLMSSADNERSDTLRRGDLNKYLFMTTQVVKKNKL